MIFQYFIVISIFATAIPAAPFECSENDDEEKNVQMICKKPFDATLRNFALDDSVSDVLDGEKAVAFVLHGYRDSIGGWVTELTKKWSDADEINVCAVDWSVWANCNYVLQRLRYVDKVANYIKKRIDFLKEKLAYENENIIIVGHSLGAQIMGKAAKKMSPGKPKFCYGLDPTGIGFAPIFGKDHLKPTDCNIVQVIYTERFLYGTTQDVGTVNVVANGGYRQPGCKTFEFNCSHQKAPEYFLSTFIGCSYTMQKGSTTDTYGTKSKNIPGIYEMKTRDIYPQCVN